ncbi:PAS domain S-box protein [Methylobacterium sp.]|uniref:PAS domain S-box protein n=1 Tax=Methylobacterium sp. TaxID=409 RepID=UPI002579AD27|nr:PAS domain S-box protein [Methylobacterium sp.]
MPHTFFAGGGQCGDLVRAYDWASTSIGPIATWPPSLRITVGTVLLSHVPMVLLWGEDGVMIYNDAYSVFAGGRHPQLLGSKVREGWPEVADFNDNVMRVGLTGGTLSYKNQELTLYRHGRPEQVWMNLDYSPVLGESSRPAGVLCILAETSERIAAERRRAEAEAAVRDSEERFRALVNASSDVVYRMNPDWTELRYLDGRGFLNDADGPSVSWLETYLFEEDRPRVLAAIGEAVRARSAFELEHRVRRADGSSGLIFSRAVPVLDDAGRLVEWFGAASDVTARDRAQAERIASDERLRAALDASDTGTFRWDIRTNALEWDEALDRLFGLTPGQTARSLDQFVAMVHPDDRAGVIARCQACAASGADFEMEFRVVYPDGSHRWLYDRGKTFRDPDGTPSYMAGACVDITERREAEGRLRASEAQLVRSNALLAAIMEAVPGVVYAKDLQGRMVALNRGTAELVGKPISEILGHTDLEFLDNRDQAEAVMANDWRIIAQGHADIVE